MKKIIATALCLTISAPCFAMGRYARHYPKHNNRPPCSVYEHRCKYNNHYRPCNTSQRTKTIAAVAGVAGVAMIISALVD